MSQRFSEAVTTGKRSGRGQNTIDCYDEFVTMWGESPGSEPLSYGGSTTYSNDNINTDNLSDDASSSSSNSLSNSTLYNYCYSSTSVLTKLFLFINNKNYFH